MTKILTPARQDYLEIIYRLELEQGRDNVRITDIAERLGTRLPTVSRTVKRMTDSGLLKHRERRVVGLTTRGRRIGAQIVHRHDDLVAFFERVLGIGHDQAEVDACQIEHGLSNRTAQRLHEFMIFVDSLGESGLALLERFRRKESRDRSAFDDIPPSRSSGWRS